MKVVVFVLVVVLAYIAYEIKNAMPYNPEWDKPLFDGGEKSDD